MVLYDTIDSDDYKQQRIYNCCNRWANNIICSLILGCHVYMIVKNINPYGII